MNAADLDAIVDTARRAACETRYLFTGVAAIDSWQALTRDAADAIGVSVADRDETALLVAGILVASQVNAHLMRSPDTTWSPSAYNFARQPLQITAGLLHPYLEERG